MLTGWW